MTTQHFYVTTDTVSPGVSSLPYIRDYDSYTYIREFTTRGSFMVGGFEPDAKPAFVGLQKIPKNWKKHCPSDWKHFAPLWKKAIHRLPILENVTKPVLHNSPDTFTPNGKWILGETPEVRNYFVAVGMNGNSLQGAGGIGRAVAEWMTHGEATQELLSFDVQRFLDLHNNRQYLQQRIREVVGRHYAIQYPHQCEFKYARNLRCSPLYSVLETRGAVFGVRMGYERPLYFDSTYRVGDPRPEMPPGTFFKPKFFDFMEEEYRACFEGVGIIDMSSFSKIKITCSDESLVDWLQQLCSNDVNIPVGGISHTGMQNERGGYENDCILVRETETSYFMVSPTSQQTRVFEWMKNHLPTKHYITLSDVTSKYTVINVVGPKAKQLLSELCDEDINLHPFSYKRTDIGYASDVKLMGFTHTGEPGYCLYIPSEYALHVYQKIMTLGKDYNARDVGMFTQRYMRIEKFIPFWAEDLNSVTTPFESGSAYRVKLDKDYFIGKAALQRQKDQGVQKRLVMFVAEDLDPDTDVWLWGSEPIYRNDQFVGTITSAGYGFTMKKLIGLGYIRHPSEQNVTNDFVTEGTYTLDVAGNRFQASAHIYPPLSNVQVARPYVPQVVNKIIG
ncbi:hypothetical protein M8J77_003944 [Diaphorina citri]|nr:hypothetical protein M8J77_003944 [Diaphorina citri]